jgi:hypothetical protein
VSAGAPGPDYSQHPELAIVSLLHMLSRFPITHCERVAESILAHLRFVAQEPRLPQIYREAAARLVADWELVLAVAPRAGEAPGGSSQLH